jgi:outer membrane protein OmpA-like peptidoglycan-associated protein
LAPGTNLFSSSSGSAYHFDAHIPVEDHMKKLLGFAAAALVLAATPAMAQRGGGGHGGGGHGGGGHVGGGGFHGGGGFRGGARIGFGFGGGCFGCGGYYPYYGYAPYYYGAPYPDPYYDYDDDYYAPPPPPPAPVYEQPYPNYQQSYQQNTQSGSRWHVTQRQGETDFELPDNVLFDLDSAQISRNADTVLQEIADAARERPGASLVVEGHTDTSGTREHNQALSDARARAVADVLVRQGVARRRIRSEGLGESQLAVETGDGVREARNRRVVVRMIGGEAAQNRDERRDERDEGAN